MLVLEQVSAHYPDGTQVLEQVSFSLEQGENIALIGANGAGKTSLMMALVGVLPTTGNIAIDDLVVEKKNLVELRQRIGMVFQNPDDQLFMATIYDDIAFGLRNQGGFLKGSKGILHS